MIEIYPNLFIGNEMDYEKDVKFKNGWNVVHACKEPYHRKLLGYSGRGAPKDHPEYLFAERENRIYLNLVDAPSPDYIPKEIIDKALEFISKSLESDKCCLVHCNQGESRSTIIGLLYLAKIGFFKNKDFINAEKEFISIYPNYNPKTGTRGFAEKNWEIYYS